MSDTTQAGEAAPRTLIRVPVTKSKDFVEVYTDEIPDDVYNEIVLQGLKVLVNRGMSKITKALTKGEAELKTLAQEAALKNVEALKAGKIKFSGGTKAKKASGAVMTEARRLAKNIVKDAMKEQGIKISHVDAKEITKAANAYLDVSPELIEEAERNVAARAEAPVAKKIDLKGLIHINPDKVAAAEAKKAKDKAGTLSAKQAGLTKKSKGQQATAH